MAKIILSAFADEYDRDINVQLQMLRDNGIGYLEPRFINEKNIADFSVTDAKLLKEKLGEIKVSSLGSPLGKIKLSDDFEKHLETARRVFETANILGTQKVRIFSFYLHEGRTRVECREEVLHKLGRMIELARSNDVILCHENEAEIYGEAPADCLDLLKNFHGNLKCVFDMGKKGTLYRQRGF